MAESKGDVFDQRKIPDVQGSLVAASAEKGAKTHQEDSWCIFCSPDKTFIAACIFDGHGGLNGRYASKKCAELSWEWFQQEWVNMIGFSKEDWEKELKTFFLKLHDNIRNVFVEQEMSYRSKSNASMDGIVDKKGVVRRSSGQPIHGGTTASVCIIVNSEDKRECICANVGDSEALLLPLNQKLLPKVQKNYLHLSVDHSPNSLKEWERIDKLPKDEYPDKLVFVYDKTNMDLKFKCPHVFLEYGPMRGTKDQEYVRNPWGHDLRPCNARYDPAVYAVSPSGVKEDRTCIAMTRALGDFYAHQFGLSWEPNIFVTALDPKCEYLVSVCSDGIWDCWKYENFSEFVTSTYQKSSQNIFQATTDILRITVEKARELFGKHSFDDASLALAVVPQA